MKLRILFFSSLILSLAACANISANSGQSTAKTQKAPNFLKAYHEKNLEDARKKENSAKSDAEKALAIRDEAIALDSLNRSQEALVAINKAMDLWGPEKQQILIETKAKIFFAMDDPKASLDTLAPELGKAYQISNSQPQSKRVQTLGAYGEDFLVATFAHMELEQWKEAIATLANSYALSEGASYEAYKSLIYRYIMARAHDPSLANEDLEKSATYYAINEKGHYGALLRLWQGENTTREIAQKIAALNGEEQQDAFSEALFYSSAYARYVKGDVDAGRRTLQYLNQTLLPFGNIEWIYSKWALQ
jgi:hypothetical protein